MTLAKILAVAVFPVGLLILLLAAALAAVAAGRRRLPAAVLAFCIAFAWISAMPAAAQRLGETFQSPRPVFSIATAPAARAIVVLGGGVAVADESGATMPGPEAGRAYLASRLFHAGKAPQIVVSGGGEPPEAVLVADLLREWAVPSDRILLETNSLTTHENATETLRMLAPREIRPILLVTSAIHMPRAVGVFRKRGFDVLPFPVGFKPDANASGPSWVHWLPTAEALFGTSRILLEQLARLYYRIRNWT